MFKVAIIGPESTGKSTLAEALAKYFGTEYIPEYSRTYLENFEGRYTEKDVVEIAKGQHKLIIEKQEDLSVGTRLATSTRTQQDTSLLIADTEIIVCKIWMEYVFKHPNETIDNLLEEQDFDLYLLCDIDLPWVYDPLRENPNLDERKELFEIYKNTLTQMNLPFEIVRGNDAERISNAINIIKKHLHE